MGKLKNTFSWSFSSAASFDECRRRRYWSKYGSWGGWEKNADEITKTAYRLNKMDNRWGLMGQAAENSVMRVLRQHQAGNPITADEAFELVARPFLREKWIQSKRGEWKTDPKNNCCIRGHYYHTIRNEKTVGEQLTRQIKNCLQNFIDFVLPRIENVKREQEIEIHTPDQGGDPENIVFEGIKMYTIPDYVYRIGSAFHIHDWKAGKIKEAHREQISIYALWANQKYGAQFKNTFLYIEYLNEPKVAAFQVTEADIEAIKTRIDGSAGEMSEYLVNGDRERNEALPKEEWDLALDPNACTFCNFYELCKEELTRNA